MTVFYDAPATPEQWQEKYLSGTPEQQVEWAERVMASAATAADCFQMDHLGVIEDLTAWRDRALASRCCFLQRSFGQIRTWLGGRTE